MLIVSRHSLNFFLELFQTKNDRGLCVSENVRQHLLCDDPTINGDVLAPGLEHSKNGYEHGDGALNDNADALARLKPLLDEEVGKAIGLAVKHAVGNGLAIVACCCLLWLNVCEVLEGLVDEGKGAGDGLSASKLVEQIFVLSRQAFNPSEDWLHDGMNGVQ